MRVQLALITVWVLLNPRAGLWRGEAMLSADPTNVGQLSLVGQMLGEGLQHVAHS